MQGDPNIPWNCTTLLQSSPKCCCWTLICVPHTHQPHPRVRGAKGSAEFLAGEKEGCCHFLVGVRGGRDPTSSPNRKHTRSGFRVKDILLPPPPPPPQKIRPSQTELEESRKAKCDQRRWLSCKSKKIKNAIWISTFKRVEVRGIHGLLSPIPTPSQLTPSWPRQTENNSKVKHSKEQSFYIFRNPYKERFLFVGFLLVILLCFLFALTNFLVIVFHCKRKRPAAICFKMGSRKEENERQLLVNIAKRAGTEARGWSLYADGTVITVLPTQKGDRCCSRSLAGPTSVRKPEVAPASVCSSYFKRKLSQGNGDCGCQVVPSKATGGHAPNTRT